MKKILLFTVAIVAFSNIGHTHGSRINITNVDKFVVRGGDQKMRMIDCMMMVKRFSKVEDAIEEKHDIIDASCEMHKDSSEDCRKMHKKAERAVRNCFLKADFVRDFFETDKND